VLSIYLRMFDRVAPNVRVFAKAGNSVIVEPGTNAQLKICSWS